MSAVKVMEHTETFSQRHPERAYNIDARMKKGRKILAVLNDYYSGKIEGLRLLDIGSSVGIISKMLSESFAFVAGIDPDQEAIGYAERNYSCENLQFKIGDGTKLDFSDESFDVVVCSHIYEHVSDPDKLLSQIYRVLKPSGVCYFAAGNRLRFIEPHYRLPLLSIMPKPLADIYLRIFKKGEAYQERHLFLKRLRRLVSRFEVRDYTPDIIRDPQRYHASDMIRSNSFSQRAALFITARMYWLCPVYIWILRKR